MILQREQPSARTFGQLIRTASDIPKEAQSLHANQRLLERIELMKAAISQHMNVIQRINGADYDKIVCLEPTMKAGDELYIYGLHHVAFASDAAKELTCKEYNKLIRRTGRP